MHAAHTDHTFSTFDLAGGLRLHVLENHEPAKVFFSVTIRPPSSVGPSNSVPTTMLQTMMEACVGVLIANTLIILVPPI